MTRPGFPYPAPPGHHWTRTVADDVQVLATGESRKCAWQRDRTAMAWSWSRDSAGRCGAGAVALTDGQLRCGQHLDPGVWIDSGLGFRWELEPAHAGEVR